MMSGKDACHSEEEEKLARGDIAIQRIPQGRVDALETIPFGSRPSIPPKRGPRALGGTTNGGGSHAGGPSQHLGRLPVHLGLKFRQEAGSSKNKAIQPGDQRRNWWGRKLNSEVPKSSNRGNSIRISQRTRKIGAGEITLQGNDRQVGTGTFQRYDVLIPGAQKQGIKKERSGMKPLKNCT